MASNWIYYPQSPLIAASTLQADLGTSSTLNNVLNNRILSNLDVDSVSSSAFRFLIDVGSGETVTPDFLAILNNNIYSASAGILGLAFSSTDSLSGTSPGGSTLYAFTIFAPTSAQETILVKTPFLGSYSKRYWWVEVTSTDASLYMGQVLIGNKVDPAIDANWELPIEYDIESGRIVNTTRGGTVWRTRTHGVRRGWTVFYEYITTDDKDSLASLWADGQVDLPLVFTNDGGTTYYCGEIVGNPTVTPMTQGLWNVNFSITEVIA